MAKREPVKDEKVLVYHQGGRYAGKAVVHRGRKLYNGRYRVHCIPAKEYRVDVVEECHITCSACDDSPYFVPAYDLDL